MLFSADAEKFVWEGIVFLAFILVCGGLTEWRYSRKIVLPAALGLLAGILTLQLALLLRGLDATLALTLLPLTAYLPALVGLHLLSRPDFFQTVAVWTVGAMGCFLLKILWKFLVQNFGGWAKLSGGMGELAVTLILLLAAAVLVCLVFRFLRAPFQALVLHNQTNWLLLSFPVLMLFLLFSYVGNATTNGTLLFLLLLTSLSLFLILTQVLRYAASLERSRKAEQEASFQLQAQRQEYEEVCRRMEMGRAYRHDMRHHLRVLDGLAKQGDTEGLARYLGRLDQTLSQVEQQVYCENATVNAVLAAGIRQAQEAGCQVEAQIRVPRALPLDEMDVCVVLANALENAVHACQQLLPEETRWIRVRVEWSDRGKLTVSVENPCREPVAVGKDGLPSGSHPEGHGIGLKSVETVVRRYQGMLRCLCQEKQFRFQAVLFAPQPGSQALPVRRRPAFAKKLAGCGILFLFAFGFLVNGVPAAARVLAAVPGIGSFVRVADLRSYDIQWGDSAFQGMMPMLETDEPTGESTTEAISGSQEASREPSAAPSREDATGQAEAHTEGMESLEEKTEETAASLLPEGLELPSGALSLEAGEAGSGNSLLPVENGGSLGSGLESQPGSTESTGEKNQAEGAGSTEKESQPESAGSAGEESQPESAGCTEEESQPEGAGSTEEESQPESAGDLEPETPPDLSNGVEDMNQQMETWLNQMEDTFWWYVSRKYQGYVGMDATYQILRNDGVLLSVRFDATLNVGGSAQYSRCFTLDKRTGQVLALADLFLPGTDYVGVISQEVRRQMEEQMAAGTGDYFLPGGIWSEEEWFREINPDQNFYLDSQNRLVVVFDEYQVAPGSMGMPEFAIPTDRLSQILRQPSVLG